MNDGWLNNGLPFFDTVVTPDGKTGRDCALEALKVWARPEKTDTQIAEAASYHRLNFGRLD